jgi:hypothetical protein
VELYEATSVPDVGRRSAVDFRPALRRGGRSLTSSSVGPDIVDHGLAHWR